MTASKVLRFQLCAKPTWQRQPPIYIVYTHIPNIFAISRIYNNEITILNGTQTAPEFAFRAQSNAFFIGQKQTHTLCRTHAYIEPMYIFELFMHFINVFSLFSAFINI